MRTDNRLAELKMVREVRKYHNANATVSLYSQGRNYNCIVRPLKSESDGGTFLFLEISFFLIFFCTVQRPLRPPGFIGVHKHQQGKSSDTTSDMSSKSHFIIVVYYCCPNFQTETHCCLVAGIGGMLVPTRGRLQDALPQSLRNIIILGV